MSGDIVSSEIINEVVRIREHLHMHPELGFEEVETSKLVAEKLRALGLEVQTGIAKTGVVGLLRGGRGTGKTILVRADMDALPLQEMNDVPYKSKVDGVMHACGHDAHVAIALGVAEALASIKGEIKGNVKFVFQPAEEGPGGAKPMVDEGVLEDPKVDASVALHVAGDFDEGVIAIRKGRFTASADEFHVVLKSPGGHGSAPHMTKDLVTIGTLLTQALNLIVSREVDPLDSAVITVGRFQAGTRHNIIGDTALIDGTIRALDPKTRDYLFDRVRTTVEAFANLYGIEFENNMLRGYPVGINDDNLTDLIVSVAKETVGEDKVDDGIPPIMGAEDFFEFGANGRIPAAMFWVGVRNEKKGYTFGNHSSRFDLGPKSLEAGVRVMTNIVLKFLES